MYAAHRVLLKSAVSGVFTHALPDIGPILIIGAIPDKAAEPVPLIIFGYNITVWGFDRSSESIFQSISSHYYKGNWVNLRPVRAL